MNQKLADKLNQLPTTPGVYFHKAQSGEIIYVGKAAVLRNRVRQYFQDSRSKDAKTMALVAEIDDTDWVETDSEIDALFLESEMVKRYMPRYNILLRDDKSQLYVRIDMKSEWPHVSFTRTPLDDKAEYYGPFYNGYALRKALRSLRRVYPYDTKPNAEKTSKLYQHIGLSPDRSLGPEAYKKDLRKLISYIKGNRKKLVVDLEREMKLAAKQHQFERAASYRNKLRAMQELQRRIMFGDKEFLDLSKDKALSDLSKLLGLAEAPVRIEGYDISHQGGKNVVASMVVFMNGTSDRHKYRKFKTSERNDDVGNIYSTVFRRFSENNIKSWGMPDLIIIDGGTGQLQAAIKAQNERQVKVPTISIAKRDEEVVIHKTDSGVSLQSVKDRAASSKDILYEEQGEFVIINLHPGQLNASGHSKNLRLSDSFSSYDEVIKLLQRVRDESHRFAVSYHTALKRAGQTKSLLDDIPGVGPATRKKLIKVFGSARGVAEASREQLDEVTGPAKAEVIYRHLRS